MVKRLLRVFVPPLVLLAALVLGTQAPVEAQFTAQIQQALRQLGIWPYDGSYADGTVPTWNAAQNKFVASGGSSGPVSATRFLAGDGLVGTPAFSFTNDSNSGFYSVADNNIGVSINGAQVASIQTAGLLINQLLMGVSTADVAIGRGAANRLDLATGDSFNIVNGSVLFANVLAMSGTAPTVTSAGTSPSVTASNGTLAFRVNVGTGGTANTIVMAMPAATTGWNCSAENLTATAANRADGRMAQQSSTPTAVTVQYQTVSTGAAKAFTASDIVSFTCTGF